ncbi:DUF1427 family protein [Fervidicella metallireducens]|uniref:XapX domain-containing protein n=1 Tax=Fervidicella metallireducens TaxID=655338 RepID=UPI0026B2856B
MKNIKEIFLSLLTGMLAGFIFAKMSLPIPAPPTLDGFMGIFGVWLGSALVELIIRKHA